MATFTVQIANAGDFAALKAIGAKIFANENMSDAQRKTVIGQYCKKRSEMDKALATTDKAVARQLFFINTIGKAKNVALRVARVGKTLHARVNAGDFGVKTHAVDLLYRAYEYQVKKLRQATQTAIA